MKRGDLVTLSWGDHDHDTFSTLPHTSPNQWYVEAVKASKPMIFLEWMLDNPGWAKLLSPDGIKKIVHCDYFVKVQNESR